MKNEDINRLYDNGILSLLDVHFAGFMLRLAENGVAELALAAALVSKFTGEGHICLDLASLAGKPLLPEGSENEVIVCPKLSAWRTLLESCPIVGMPGDYKPLILDDKSRLYLYRYWDYEKKLAVTLRKRIAKPDETIDFPLLREGLRRIFPVNEAEDTDWQKVAAATAVLKKFCVVSGGPGTGKTSTVVKILVLLLEQARTRVLRIALAAPTGKAAARLQTAVKNAKKGLDCSEEIKQAIPEETFTIHRLLGSLPYSPYFRYNGENKLSFDVVVVDEVSMVSLALMSKLNEAIPLNSRLVLLGDKNQLASVEAGAVLGDICDTGRVHSFTRQYSEIIQSITEETVDIKTTDDESGMDNCIVHLQKSFRFGSDSGIDKVSRAVNKGDGNRALRILKSNKFQDIKWSTLPRPNALFDILKERIITGFERYLKASDPEEALRLFDRFRILCAVRNGPYGVAALNHLSEEILTKEKLIVTDRKWYPGRPVLIDHNDYDLRLFNGDVGIILPDPKMNNEPHAFFSSEGGAVRKFSLVRLPELETVYAMTVHKSQGSEFDDVLFVMPDRQSPVLTRELIYTGITRAKKSIKIEGVESVFKDAVAHRIERSSGLRDALWGV
ncbi:MAG: exodeoxyribonuclease V subunit alpha [Proteobacteria bacterium]|nr:exodeoxyribonuclease V subunit alpha [Pseudomonadota bacterium]